MTGSPLSCQKSTLQALAAAITLLLVMAATACSTRPSASPDSGAGIDATGTSSQFSELQAESSAWFKNHSSLTRDLERDLTSGEATIPIMDTQPLFSRGAYTYVERSEQGAVLPSLVRMASGRNTEELVYSPTFGSGGYPFLLSHYAICPSDRRVAIAGTVGPLSLLCVREPAPGTMTCTESTEIGGLAWAADCESVYFTSYENGRAARLFRASAREPESALLLLEEGDPSFSIALNATEDEQYVLATIHSAQAHEIYVLTGSEVSQQLVPAVSRRLAKRVRLHRGFDRWLIWESDSNTSSLSFLESLSPLVRGAALSRSTAAWSLSSVVGFHSFAVVLGRSGANPEARIIGPQGKSHTVALPENTTKLAVLPAQQYGQDLVRVSLGSPLFRSVTCSVQATSGLVTCHDRDEELIDARLERLLARSKDSTQIPITVVVPTHVAKGASPLLRVYGSYGVALEPEYSPELAALLEAGIPVAFGHIRGGGEYGPAWHQAAVGINRLKGAEDVLAAARALKERFGRVPLLQARSAGALVAALSLQADQSAFGGALLESPFLNVTSVLANPALPASVREYAEWGNPGDPNIAAFWKRHSPSANAPASWTTPLLVSVGSADEAIQSEEAIQWLLLQRSRRARGVPMLLQWVPGGRHDGAHYLADERHLEAERLATLLSFAQ